MRAHLGSSFNTWDIQNTEIMRVIVHFRCHYSSTALTGFCTILTLSCRVILSHSCLCSASLFRRPRQAAFCMRFSSVDLPQTRSAEVVLHILTKATPCCNFIPHVQIFECTSFSAFSASITAIMDRFVCRSSLARGQYETLARSFRCRSCADARGSHADVICELCAFVCHIGHDGLEEVTDVQSVNNTCSK
jgi:hypothetical protein